MQELKVDANGEPTSTFAERSRNLLFLCRQFSAFLLDSDLAAALVERTIKENQWVFEHPPLQNTESERVVWRHDYESLDEGLHDLLDGFRIRSKYAQMYEQRAKIGIDEVSTSNWQSKDDKLIQADSLSP